MENLVEVFFRVRMPRLRDWQMVLVVGSTNTLGEWDPTKAMQLTKCNIDNVNLYNMVLCNRAFMERCYSF
uniref:CBM20 domain-containing protein n=1 Tax=Heterorhabditis bacteriophora TaxID=37862 RepID=A0A1I7WB90_HETBA